MNNETIVYEDYGHAIDSVLWAYGVATLIALVFAVKAVIANV